MANDPKLRDPRTLYPQPPFPQQEQPEPGLAQEMEPLPDHGEESYKGSRRLQGRRALITGGDSGIGRAVAIAYAREGAEVCINYLPVEGPDAGQVADLLTGEGHSLHKMPGDVSDEATARKLVNDAAEKMGGLDILVINAGKQITQPHLTEISSEQFDQTMKTNVYAMFWMTQEALKVMPPGAAIINVTSIQGYKPSAQILDYATTKFAIRGFTEGLAPLALERGIRVNGIAPGPFWTPLQPSHGQPMEKVEHFGEGNPMGRPGQPAEIAPAFVYLASNEASYTVGEILGVTGGKPTS
ncbi:SDR family oxidoreductase [Tranquillimonas alkanivorans]|uniref:Uncharacterized oxidoreductase YghA n=1 Tax=Tranquillimonas alkanivorans TaxID=441119 RepID=A0A1I5M8L6_9RHOB|nr:SDR family oxidoreductase [Tranquillimonas alkanivorans]SFP05865.1 Enoyl-(Acyl carrier protein) reductase [Tranquillimonas alkanivorans]